MKISFKGIENIKILKAENKKNGYYLDDEKTPHPVTEDLKQVIITGNLTNDVYGKDLSDYKNALEKVLNKTHMEYYDAENNNNFEIHLNKRDLIFENSKKKDNTLLLNKRKLFLNNDEILPIYSFMAKLITKLTQRNDLSEHQKKYLNIVGNAIKEDVYEYLDIEY